jgi:hypothetical protein
MAVAFAMHMILHKVVDHTGRCAGVTHMAYPLGPLFAGLNLHVPVRRAFVGLTYDAAVDHDGLFREMVDVFAITGIRPCGIVLPHDMNTRV